MFCYNCINFLCNIFYVFIFSSLFPGLSTLANVVTSLATMDGSKQNGSGESEEDSQTNAQNGDLPQKETSNEVQSKIFMKIPGT